MYFCDLFDIWLKINIPLVLDSTNYDYWKSVVKRWKHPMITSQDGSTSLKFEVDWSKDEEDGALSNDKALNVVFNCVDKNIFRLINTYTEAK